MNNRDIQPLNVLSQLADYTILFSGLTLNLKKCELYIFMDINWSWLVDAYLIKMNKTT